MEDLEVFVECEFVNIELVTVIRTGSDYYSYHNSVDAIKVVKLKSLSESVPSLCDYCIL